MCYPAVIVAILIVAACAIFYASAGVDKAFDDARKDDMPW